MVLGVATLSSAYILKCNGNAVMEAGGGSACEDCGLADNTAGSPSLLLLLPVLLSVLWILFQLFYTPWLLAFLITKLTNLWLTDSAIYIGRCLLLGCEVSLVSH